jgi:hypothetical protein
LGHNIICGGSETRHVHALRPKQFRELLRSNRIITNNLHNRFFGLHLATSWGFSLQLPGEGNYEWAEENRNKQNLKR